MSLWKFCDKNVGDEIDGYVVLAVKMCVPLTVNLRNYEARKRGCSEEPEIPQKCCMLAKSDGKV